MISAWWNRSQRRLLPHSNAGWAVGLGSGTTSRQCGGDKATGRQPAPGREATTRQLRGPALDCPEANTGFSMKSATASRFSFTASRTNRMSTRDGNPAVSGAHTFDPP
jgi:hypothetical protein